ncbi:FAD-dependent hydroxylase [Laspinema olomoucense]|uniref:FAD-dependent hydroxylase n=1 Tax=Laspinema olomoucense TaxID=3231600 RepID=UPI0021BAF653|nr:FAD-dependent hydroxylase [Laspinema sp. D3d]MCT7971315.1 FAD-dependent hydroxylase [Laspinema sp. D3d]
MPLQQLTRETKVTPGSESAFDYDVAIAGGGIAGTTLAASLKDSGLKVVLIEALPPSVAASRNQVYALSLLSGQIFEAVGVWERILPKITPFNQISLSDSGREGVRFQPGDLGRETLGYVGEHQVLLTALQDFLTDCAHVTWKCPAEVLGVEYQADGVVVEVRSPVEENPETQRIRTRVLIAADGARSQIREAAGIKTQGWKYWQSCITVQVKPEKPHANIAYERFWPSGPFAILPLTENRCNIVWTAPHEEAKALAALNEAEFLVELQKRYGEQMGRVQPISDRRVFSVQLMQSSRYVQPRLALIGDAAHCCHPVGGQGQNLGIRDAAAIAEILTQAHHQGEDIGSLAVLKRYERWRKLENLTILGFTDLLDRLFSNQFLPAVILRHLGLWGLRTLPPVKQFALRLMTGQLGRHPETVKALSVPSRSSL